MSAYYVDVLVKITKAASLQDAKNIAWAALSPVPEFLTLTVKTEDSDD